MSKKKKKKKYDGDEEKIKEHVKHVKISSF